MSNTVIWENKAVHALRALVLSHLDKIVFRHHGIGALQGYVQENCEPEIRVHLWSRRLLKPAMEVSGDIHDHRFDMVSHVLAGTVLHEELLPTPDPAGTHVMMALTHARAAADTGYHGPTTPIEGRFRVRRKLYQICEGFSYSFRAGKFHHSPIHGDDVAVTVIEKWRQSDAKARLLYPVDHEPVMAFGHTPDQELIRSVVEAARSRLMGVSRKVDESR